MPKHLPSISVIIPTLNSERTFADCLESIASQKYKGSIEIIVADGGSQDKTLKIAKSYKAKIIKNKLVTAEAGKAIGVKIGKGEILAFIDSDNILPENTWLEKMIAPFLQDAQIIASEPLYFTYRKKDSWLTRYFALLGMGDPLSLYIGNYDRYSHISNKWTELKLKQKNHPGYISLELEKEIPTIGANGFLIKKSSLLNYPIKDYLFDIDVLAYLNKIEPVKIAKVKIGIVHLFTGTISGFVRKQRRRIKDYLFYKSKGVRAETISNERLNIGKLKFIISTILVLPLLVEMVKGFKRKPDLAWLFHPLACWLTLFAYSYEIIKFIFIKQAFSRTNWKQ